MKTNSDLSQKLIQFGLSKTQAEIFVYIYQYGPAPASTVAKYTNIERTTCYKAIQTMVKFGLIAETRKNNVAVFWVTDLEVLSQYISIQKSQIQQSADMIPDINKSFAELDIINKPTKPQIRFFEGKNGIDKVRDDIYQTYINSDILLINILSTNQMDSRVGTEKALSEYIYNIYNRDSLTKKPIIKNHIIDGINILQNVYVEYDLSALDKIAAGGDTVNIILIADSVYILLWSNPHRCIKITNHKLAQVFHFVLDNLG